MSWYIRADYQESDPYIVASETGKGLQIGHKTLGEAITACNYLNGGDGLTKLERFTLAAMQGIITSSSDERGNPTQSDEIIARWAVAQSVALLDELEKQS